MKRYLTIAAFLLGWALPVAAQTPWELQLMQAVTGGGKWGNPRYTTAARFTCNSTQLGAKIENTTTGTEQRCNGSAWVDTVTGSGGITIGTTTITGGTSTRVLFDLAGVVGEDADLTFLTDTLTATKGAFPTSATVGTTTTAGTATTVLDGAMGGASATDNFLNITGTLPTTLSAVASGVLISLTGAGNSASQENAVEIAYNAGYTGAVRNNGLLVSTATVGGGIGYGTYTGAITGHTTGAAAVAFGVVGRNDSGAPTLGIGVVGYGNSGVTRNGVVGIAASGGTNGNGGYFALGEPTLGGNGYAALSADNLAVAADIFRAKDNGTPVFVVADGGTVVTGSSQFAKSFSGTKATITEASAQAILRVGIGTSTNVYGMTVFYTIYDINGANYVARTGSVKVQGGNSGGTATCTINTTQDQETEDGSQIVTSNAATLTYTWTNVVSTTNCDLSLNASSSEGVNTVAIAYRAVLNGNATGITLTAQ